MLKHCSRTRPSHHGALEEKISQYLNTIHVGSIDGTCRRQHNNALIISSSPVDILFHILPIGRVVADKIIETLSGGLAAHLGRYRSDRDLSLRVLVGIGFERRCLLNFRAQLHTAAVELGVLVLLRSPCLHVSREYALRVRLLRLRVSRGQKSQGECSQSLF